MRITCIVDNCARRSSRLWAEHGLAFLVESQGQTVLWDTGQTTDIFEHNLAALGLTDLHLDAIALSHAHYDHTGGLRAILARQQPPIYAHPAIVEPRFSRRGGQLRPIGMNANASEMPSLTNWRLSAAPVELIPGVWTSGDISPRPHPLGNSARHFVERAGRLLPDDYADDMSLVLRVHGGIVLLCGCCHAGLLNTLATVRRQYDEPLLAILGGTHLADASEAHLDKILAALQIEQSPQLYLNHCTGEATLTHLARHGVKVNTCPAGATITFEDHP